MSAWIILTVLALIALAAPRYGADSRNVGATPTRSASLRADLALVGRAIARWARVGPRPTA